MPHETTPKTIKTMRKVYEVIIVDAEGNAIDSRYFSSHKKAREFKTGAGHVSCIAEWPVE